MQSLKKIVKKSNRIKRQFRSLPPENYITNQRDANNTKRIHNTSLFPLKNSSKIKITKLETIVREQQMKLSSLEFLMGMIGKIQKVEISLLEPWKETTLI